jgi:hypothetical protein
MNAGSRGQTMDYATHVRALLKSDPDLQRRTPELLANDLEASLFNLCLDERFIYPAFRSLEPRDYGLRLASLEGMLPAGERMLQLVERYQLSATILQNMLMGGALYEAQDRLVDIHDLNALVDFMQGIQDLRDCLLHNVFALLLPEPELLWHAIHPEAYGDIFLRGITQAETVIQRLELIRHHTTLQRGG